MTLFRPSHEKRTVDATADLISRASGRFSATGITVNDDSALRLGAYWAATDLIAELVSTLPVDEYRNVERVRIPQTSSQLLLDPAGDGTGFEVWCRQVVMSLLTRGNGYGLILGIGTNGWPNQVESLHPDRVTWKRKLNFGPVTTFLDNQEIDRWPNGPLWHVPAYVLPGSPVGLSPVMYAAETIGVGLATQRFGAQWFGDGAHPTSIYTSEQPITQTDAETIKARIVAATRDNREPLVLGAGGALTTIQVSPEESQFLETVSANVADVARFFRVPPEMIGGDSGTSMTYANVESRSLALLTYTLNPWLVRVERALTRLLPRPRFVKFNADALLRTDLATRYKAHDLAVRGGWKSRDEVREVEDMKPIPDGSGAEHLWPPYAVVLDQGGDDVGPTQPA